MPAWPRWLLPRSRATPVQFANIVISDLPSSRREMINDRLVDCSCFSSGHKKTESKQEPNALGNSWKLDSDFL